MDAAPTKNKREQLGKKYGIVDHSVLDCIPSICQPDSYPHEYLHLFLLNHGKGLVKLWIGEYPGIDDSGNKDYLISPEDWAAIGRETEEAANTLPAAFVRRLPNIQTNPEVFCGETWAFWLVFIGPVVLHGQLPKYYEHYMDLMEIMTCLTLVTNTTARIEELKIDIANYAECFEE